MRAIKKTAFLLNSKFLPKPLMTKFSECSLPFAVINNNINTNLNIRSFHASSKGLGFMNFFKSSPNKSSLELLQLQADTGDSIAQNNLGAAYQNGTGVDIDYKKAVYWYEKSAEQNNSEAQFNLGYLYQEGLGVPKNIEIALQFFEKSANQNHVKAQNNLGVQYLAIGDKSKALYWFKKASDNGYAKAQYNLGGFYARGDAVEKNPFTAFDWYLKSAEGGYVHSQHNVGIMYFNGIGVKQDYQIGIQWLEKAASQGFQGSIAALHEISKKDYSTDVNWLEQLANKGDVSAQNNLGAMYNMGTGVKEDKAKAIYWLQKAADQGNDNSLFNLGAIYLNGGEGVPKDLEKARSLFSKIKNPETKKAAEVLLRWA
ncbi:predicted protein [Naegleria gruberi]|uniref:Predicted protein n=1 Tax=Naegleria gruberi TaxID=5762 RepID=D2VU60_NAEGR|nr:uncharacterized protein NAEGRDRAFT_52272 [Naegleria gruberi]EFC39629.1 predicted protein [Naegleria gruberi]|eukprot:XP_002672373.1 predicted protein [Naegleria gruberi strain NEG-M]